MAVEGSKIGDTSIPANVQLYAVDFSGQLIPVLSDTSGHIAVDVSIGDIIAVVSGTVAVSGTVGLISGHYPASGIHIVAESGIGVLISGQTVAIGSGAYLASGIQVINQSGIGVLISGQTVAIASGVYLASGVQVINESGIGVLISGQTVAVASGHYPASGTHMVLPGTQVSGTVAVSGTVTGKISGETVVIASGAWPKSGIEIIWRGAQVSGTVGVSGTVTGKISGETVVVASGAYLRSGLEIVHRPANMSGLFFASGTGVLVNASGNVIEAVDHKTAHIHEGIRFAVSDYDNTVAETSGLEKVWRVKAPDGAIRAHFEFDVGVDNESLIELRENPTVTYSGVSIFVRNKERNSATSATVEVYKDALITSGTGINLLYMKTGSTGTKEHMGGDGWGGNWVLKQDEEYALIVYVVNAATGVSMIMKWDEE